MSMCLPGSVQFEGKPIVGDPLVSIERDLTEMSWCVRIRISLLVVMNLVTVEKERRILRDVQPVVYKVFS
jgi:hypothetical protein